MTSGRFGGTGGGSNHWTGRPVWAAGVNHARAVQRRGGDHGRDWCGLQWTTVRSTAMAWVLTLPAATLMSGSLYCVLRQVM
jgi:phosphate/sulfate permease